MRPIRNSLENSLRTVRAEPLEYYRFLTLNAALKESEILYGQAVTYPMLLSLEILKNPLNRAPAPPLRLSSSFYASS